MAQSKFLSATLLFLILILAFWLRITGLSWGLPQGEHFVASYRPDEYSLFAWLRQMQPQKADFNPHIYLNGTLLLFALAGFYKILSLFGILTVSSDPVFYYQNVAQWARFYWFGRLAMVFIGVFTVWVIYRAGRLAFGKSVGLIASALYAIVPLHVVSSKHLLVEPAATLWFSGMIFFCFKIIRRGKWKNYLLAALTLGSAAAVKVTCFSLAALLVIAHFLSCRNQAEKRGFLAIVTDPRLWASMGTAGVSYLLFNPYLILNLKEALAEASDWYQTYQGWSYLGYGPLFSLTHLLPYGLGPLFFVWAVASCFSCVFWPRREISFLVIGLLLHFYANARTGTVIVKYHVTLLPFTALLTAYFFNMLFQSSRQWIRIPIAAVFVWMFLDTLSLSLAYDGLFLKPDVRDEASRWIRRNIPSGKQIGLYGKPYDHSPPMIYNQYFFRGRSPIWQVSPLYEIIDFGADLSKISEKNPEYFIMTARENREFRRNQGNYDPSDDWGLFEPLIQEQGYRLIQTFDAQLERFGKPLPKGFPPDDWQQILPRIRIYQRVKS